MNIAVLEVLEVSKKTNCIGFACLMKTSLGSVNGGFTEGNVITLKKVTLPDGRTLPYVSGQAIRRMLRDRLEEMGEKMSELHLVAESGKKATKSPDFTEGNPIEFTDDDLFGYLNAEGGKTRRRTAPVRTSAAVGMFPYAGDRDLGTKSKERTTGDVEAGGSLFETEISYNVFRANILVELDRFGVFLPSELQKGGKGEKIALPEAERRRRLKALIRAIGELWGGGKQSRLLTDMGPQLLIYTQQSRKKPVLLERLMMNEKGELVLAPIEEALRDSGSPERLIQKTIVGLTTGFLPQKNETEFRELMKSLNIDVVSVEKAIEEIIKQVEGLSLPKHPEATAPRS